MENIMTNKSVKNLDEKLSRIKDSAQALLIISGDSALEPAVSSALYGLSQTIIEQSTDAIAGLSV